MKIAIIAGSNRRESASNRMAGYIGKRLAALGHSARVYNLRDNPLPLYDPDAPGMPEAAAELAKQVGEADAVVLSTPEYHGSISGVLKNALDYLDTEHFDGKMVLSVSAAGGAVGVSALTHLQVIVRNLHGINCPDWISVGGALRMFDAAGEPANEQMRARVERVLGSFIRMADQFRVKVGQ